MAWDGALLPASWRGIPFFIDTHEKTGGRNAVSHEPPDRDSSFSEDMGKRHDGFRIRGHILGDTYFFIRDALISAMEAREPGILIHPYLGLIDAQPAGYTFSEDTLEGRICRFELNFVEAGDPNVVFAIIDKVTSFVTSIVAAVAQVQNAFALTAAFSGLPGYAIDSAKAISKDFQDSVKASIAKIKANGEALANINKKLDEFEDQGDNLLVSDPAAYASSVDDILSDLKDLPSTEEEDTSTINTKSDKAEQVSVYDDLLVFGTKDESTPLTPTEEQEQINNNALIDLIRRNAMLRASEAAANQSYFSEDAAVAQRNELNDFIDSQLNIEGIDDNLFQALLDQKASNVDLIPDPRKESGTTEVINLLQTTPSLVLVYEEYGDVARETDVLDRNKIQNPAFIDGEIEIVKFG